MKGKRLGNHCIKIGSGATPRGGKDVYLESGDVALIRSQNIYNDHFERSGLVFLLEEHAAQLENVSVESGDILLNITGDSVARVCQVPNDVLPARVNQHVAIIRPDPNEIDPRFLRFYLASPQMQAQMLGLASAGATRNALTKGMIEDFIIPPIEIDRQREIGRMLGALEDKIDLNHQMNETLESMARAIFKDWFVDFGPVRAKMEGRKPPGLAADVAKLFPEKMNENERPEGWNDGSIEDVAKLNRKSWSKTTRPDEIEYVDLGNTKWGQIQSAQRYTSSEAPSRAQRVLSVGDTIVGTVRPGNGSYALVGKSGLTGSTGFAVLSPIKDFYREFVYCAVTSRENIQTLAQLADGAAYPAVRPEVVLATPVCIPTEAVFRAFAASTAPLFDRYLANSEENETLAKLRDLLLPKLMNGEIRLGELDVALGEAK